MKKITLFMLVGLFPLLGAAQSEAEFLNVWDLPGTIETALNGSEFGYNQPDFQDRFQLELLQDQLAAKLLKTNSKSGIVIKNVTESQLEIPELREMVVDSVGVLVLWGDSLPENKELTIFKKNFHAKQLYLHGLSDCKVMIQGHYDLIQFSNCTNLQVFCEENSFSISDFPDIGTAIVWRQCTLEKSFSFKADGKLGKVEFDACTFDLENFDLKIPDSTSLVLHDSPLNGIGRVKPSWTLLSNWLVPQGYLFWGLRAIDSLGRRYCHDYDFEISAEQNKLAWTENLKIVLHQFQEHYRSGFEFERSDSVFRTLKEIEEQTYLHAYTTPEGKDRFKAGVHYFFMSFMGWFCGYGTEPIMALYNAALLILVFAVVYIIFPNRFDDRVPLAEDGFFFLGLRVFAGERTEVDQILSSFRQYMALNPNGSIWSFYLHRRKRLLAHYRGMLPSGLSYYLHASTRNSQLGKRLMGLYLRLAMLPYMVQLIMLSLVERHTRLRWAELSKHGERPSFWKIVRGRNLLILLGVLLLLVLARIPVGLLVSVNAFSTLGFGKLPLRGIAKYVAILEGLVGWFTLTLFSITYVNILLR